MVTAGLVAYELSNILSGHPIDPDDIAATLICGLLAVPIWWVINRWDRNPPGMARYHLESDGDERPVVFSGPPRQTDEAE